MRLIALSFAALVTATVAAGEPPRVAEEEVRTGVSGRVMAAHFAHADIEGMTVSVRYKLWPLLGEPVELYLMKYDFSDRASIVLTPSRVNDPRWTIRSDPSLSSGAVREVKTSDKECVFDVAPDVFRLLGMSDPWFCLYGDRYIGSCKILRKNPGALSRAGRWSFDSPGSPNWEKMFYYDSDQRLAQSMPVDGEKFNRTATYMSVEEAKTKYKAIIDRGKLWDCTLGVYAVELRPGDLLSAVRKGGTKPRARDSLDDALDEIDDPRPRPPFRRIVFYLTQGTWTEEQKEERRRRDREQQAVYDRQYERDLAQYQRDLAAWEQRRKERRR